MSPFEALYGRKCGHPVTWVVNRIVLGLEILKEMEQENAKIRENLKETKYRWKRYAHKNRVHVELN